MKTIASFLMALATALVAISAHAANYNGYVQGESPVVGGWFLMLEAGSRGYHYPFGNIQPVGGTEGGIVTPVTGAVGLDTTIWGKSITCYDEWGTSYVCGYMPPATCPLNTVQMSAVDYVRSDTKSLPSIWVTGTGNTTTFWTKSLGTSGGISYYGICTRHSGNNYCPSIGDAGQVPWITSVIDEVGYRFDYINTNMVLCVQTDTYQ